MLEVAAQRKSAFGGTALAAGLLLTFLILALVSTIAWIESKSGDGHFLNADLVQPYLLMHDVVRDPTALAAWGLSPANFAFPDCLVAGVLALLKIPLAAMPLWYAGFILAGYVLAIGTLIMIATGIRLTTGLMAAGVQIAAVLMAGFALSPTVGGTFSIFLAVNFMHTGSIFSGLFTLVAVSALGTRSRHPVVLLALCLLALAAAFSDALYIVWFLIPPIIAWWGYAWRQGVPGQYRRCLLVFGAGVAGAVLSHLLLPSPRFGAPNYGRMIRVWYDLIILSPARGDWLTFASAMLSLAMVAVGVAVVGRLWEKRPVSRLEFVLLLLAGVQIASFAAPIIAGRLQDYGELRYSLPIFIVPYIWLTIVVTDATARVGRLRLPRLVLLLPLAVVLVAAGPQSIAASEQLGTSSPLVTCLLNAGLTDGLSDYWHAKPLIFESNYAISIEQLAPDATILRDNYNGRWFSLKADGSGPVAPTFVVIDGLDQTAAAARYGTPARTLNCPGSTVWVYPHVLAMRP